MARPRKDDLLEEAREMGLEVDADIHYDELFALVRDHRTDADEDAVPEVVEGPGTETFSTGFDSLGIWRGKPRR